MTAAECTACQEWLDLEAPSGQTAPSAVRRHLEQCSECRAERETLTRLHRALSESRAAVRPDFRAQVMRSLPAAPWEGRAPRSWRLPLAAFAVLGGTAAALAGLSGAQLDPGVPFLTALAALAGLFQSSLVAGAGLTAASWSGVGAALGEFLGGSKLNLAAFVVVVAGIDVLLVSLLRRHRSAPVTVRPDSFPDPTGR